MLRAIDTERAALQGWGVDLDTALLRAFVATADHANVGRAAQELHLSQQGLSKRLGRLEGLLGVSLFEREPRGMAITEAGARFLPFARSAVEAVDAAAAAMGAGALRIDVMDEHSAAMELVRAAVDRGGFRDVTTAVRPTHEGMVDGLLGGRVEIAFGRASVTPWPRELKRRPALFEPLGLLVGAEHPLSARGSVTMAELAGIPLRFPLAGAPQDWIDYLAQLAAECGISVDTDGCSLGFESFLDMPARDGQLATFLGLNMAPPKDPRARVIPIVDPTPVFPWAVAWRRRWPVSDVESLVGSEPPILHGSVWMPRADREWIGA